MRWMAGQPAVWDTKALSQCQLDSKLMTGSAWDGIAWVSLINFKLDPSHLSSTRVFPVEVGDWLDQDYYTSHDTKSY